MLQNVYNERFAMNDMLHCSGVGRKFKLGVHKCSGTPLHVEKGHPLNVYMYLIGFSCHYHVSDVFGKQKWYFPS